MSKLLAACLLFPALAWGQALPVLLTATAVDWAQSRTIASRPGPGGYTEGNPLLGHHPSRDRVNLYFAGVLAAEALWADRLPPAVLCTLAAVEVGVVAHNAYLGIRLTF